MEDIEQGLSQSERIALAQKAYREFYARCFWHLRPDLELDERHLEIIARGLRRYGGKQGFALASTICP